MSDLQIIENSSNAGGYSAAQSVAHETLEAYHSATNGTTLDTAILSHTYANKFFPGFYLDVEQQGIQYYSGGKLTHLTLEYTLQDQKSQLTNHKFLVERQYVTPIDPHAIPPHRPSHIVDSRKK